MQSGSIVHDRTELFGQVRTHALDVVLSSGLSSVFSPVLLRMM